MNEYKVNEYKKVRARGRLGPYLPYSQAAARALQSKVGGTPVGVPLLIILPDGLTSCADARAKQRRTARMGRMSAVVRSTGARLTLRHSHNEESINRINPAHHARAMFARCARDARRRLNS